MATTEKHEEKASEILARAAKLLNDAPKVYEANFELMKEQDALQQDLLHKLEIENLTRDERAKLAAELRDCRRLRRKYKDVVEELEPIAGYCGTAAGMQAVKQLSRFVGDSVPSTVSSSDHPTGLTRRDDSPFLIRTMVFLISSTGLVIHLDNINTSRTIAPIMPAIMIRSVRISDFCVAVKRDCDTRTNASRL